MVVRRKNPYRPLEKALGYGFRRRINLEAALTHRSFRFENADVSVDNQRLEFLGDAVLGLLTAAYVYRQHEDRDEGVLTSFRSQTTSGRALARYARAIDLGSFLKIGAGEDQSGGRERASPLADALEAVIGAAFVDGGMRACEKIFKRVFVPRLEALSGDVWAHNPKGKLQEYSQRRWKCGPTYRVLKREGPAHATVFRVEVRIGDGTRAAARGQSKQEAETRAASKLLEHLADV